MINLISNAQLSELRAARRNVGLMRLNLLTLAVSVIVMAILIGTYIFLMIQYAQAQTGLEKANEEKKRIAADIKAVDTFKKDLAAAKTILSNEITLSNLAIIMTDAIPQGVVVDSLIVDPTTLSDPQTITIFAKSASDAIGIKQQFTNSPYITSAFIQDVTDQSTTTSGVTLERPFRITLIYSYDVAAIVTDTKKRTEEGR